MFQLGYENKQFPVVIGPLKWRTWSEPTVSNLPVISSVRAMEQLNITNDETNYLWYRRNVTLKRVSSTIIVTVQTHDHAMGGLEVSVELDLSHFKTNQQYLFEILSVALGINTGVESHGCDHKGLVGEYFQIYTEKGSSKVSWDTQWTKDINKPIKWFQTRFDLNNLIKDDTVANPI